MALNFFKDLFDGKKRPPKVDITRRFELLGRVGQGSMSRVWRARDTTANRIVGLKVLDKEKTKRFEARFPPELKKPSEGEVAVTLNHPHIVKTYEWGITTDDEQFLVMEFVTGLGLSYLIDVQNEVMQQHRLSFMIQLGEAVKYFHDQKWIHRDLCPRNIMVTDGDQQIKLIDFGLVVPNTAPFQAPGNRTGTANYMAPELIKRMRTDHRIDIFSYSVTCYEMFTRRQPWEAAETLEAVLQHINSPPIDIRDAVPGIDEQVAATIMKGLEVEPHNRWPSVEPMLYQLREVQARLTPAAKPKGRGMAGITLADEQPERPVARKKPAAAATGTPAAAAPANPRPGARPLPKPGTPVPGIQLADDAPQTPPAPKKKPVPSPGISLADEEDTTIEPPPSPKPPRVAPGIVLADEHDTIELPPEAQKPPAREPPPRRPPPTPGIQLADDDE